MIQKKLMAKGTVVKVTFELPGDKAETSASVVGDFNDWDAGATPMQHVKSRDVWKAQVKFDPGTTHEFRYLLDGERWENDEDADDYANSGMFTDNCVIQL